MTGVSYRRDTCRLCGGRDLQLVMSLAPAPIVDAYVPAERLGQVQERYPLDLFLCCSCGHSQLLDVVDPQVLYGEYLYETTSSLGLVDHFQKYADQVLDQTNPAPGSLVVDIGSNDGTLLRSFQRRGMKVLGVDPAHDIARRATESGIETLPLFFNTKLAPEIKADYGPAAVVTVNNLFANVDDLAGLTDGIRQLLAPDGVFSLESFYLVDLIQNMVFDFIYHEHLNCFTVSPLDSFFRRSGMELISVERVPTKGGSLRATVQVAGGPREVSPSVAKLVALEKRIGVQRPEIFQSFNARIESIKEQVAGLLRELREQGNSIAGYGASATTTTLIYELGLGDLMGFIVDDNPSRQHLFSPGYHIPVLPAEAIYEQKPDYVVLLAWRYREPIVKKHQDYLDQGGHFIVPLPEIEVI